MNLQSLASQGDGLKPKQAPLPLWKRYLYQLTSKPQYIVVGAVVLALVGSVAMNYLWHLLIAGVGVAAIPVAVTAATAIDPILIAVTEDNVWISVLAWED